MTTLVMWNVTMHARNLLMAIGPYRHQQQYPKGIVRQGLQSTKDIVTKFLVSPMVKKNMIGIMQDTTAKMIKVLSSQVYIAQERQPNLQPCWHLLHTKLKMTVLQGFGLVLTSTMKASGGGR